MNFDSQEGESTFLQHKQFLFMTEGQTMVTFEVLPNEILVDCFEYLSTLEIFHAFDQLNCRFSQLIRNIPLYLDFHNVDKSIFERFCMKMVFKPKMRQQVHSLQLSNEYECAQISAFLGFFSLSEYPRLQSLTCTNLKENNLMKLKFMLASKLELSCFRLVNPTCDVDEIMSILPTSKLRMLAVPHLGPQLEPIYKNSFITNLSVDRCDLDQLHQVLENAPMLKYLRTENLNASHFGVVNVQYKHSSINGDRCTRDYRGVNLRQLVISSFDGKFQQIEGFLQKTPNLKSLTIVSHHRIDIVDASRWKNLINTSLSYLTVFQFDFEHAYFNNKDIIRKKLQQFQRSFWRKQHHWNTEYSLSNCSARVYTIPYFSFK